MNDHFGELFGHLFGRLIGQARDLRLDRCVQTAATPHHEQRSRQGSAVEAGDGCRHGPIIGVMR